MPAEKIKTKRKREVKPKVKHRCCHCGKEYNQLRNNFNTTTSSIYSGLKEGETTYLPICKECLKDLFNDYLEEYDDDHKKAVLRICREFDIYYSDALYKTAFKGRGGSFISTYLSRVNSMLQYKGKHYEDYLNEKQESIIEERNTKRKINLVKDVVNEETLEVSDEIKEIFGDGYSDEDYILLYKFYDEWMTTNECNTTAQQRIFRELAFAEYELYNARLQGDKNVDNYLKRYQSLMEAGNVSPKQNNKDALSDAETFGTLIQKWENEEPIMDADEKWKDVDGIGKYIETFFYGHLGKSLGIKSVFSTVYDSVMDKLSVNKSIDDSNDEEKNEIMDAMFGKKTEDE